MTLDEIILKDLAHGPSTVHEIAMRLERRVRIRLGRLLARGLVTKEWKVGHRQFAYRLPSEPNRLASGERRS